MLSRQFLSWAESAPAGARADAGHALARAFLYADLDPIELGEMERALTCLLDDPSPLVRRALAEALAGAAHAPHHLVSALACDQGDVAAIVLGRSPILTDAELIDAAALGGTAAQCAIAARAALSAAVSGALAEVGTRDAVLALCRNGGADLAEVSLRRILERFGLDGGVREALGGRQDLGTSLRHELVVATAEALRRFVTACQWIAPERARRVVGEANDRAAIALARQGADREGEGACQRFVGHLRRAGHLTPALVLRAVLSGEVALFEAALAELSGQPLSRVAGLVRRHEGLGFAALVRAAGLPEIVLPAIVAALDVAGPHGASPAAGLRRETVAQVLARCGLGRDAAIGGLTALLRRFETEAARDESRAGEAERPAPTLIERMPLPTGRPGAPHQRTEPRFDILPSFAAAA